MNNVKALEEIIKVNIKEKISKRAQDICDYYENNYKKIDGSMKEEFGQVFKKAVRLQEKGLKEKIFYIIISVLRTNILDNCYKCRIDLYDERYFLDKTECSGYFDAEFILKYIDEDISDYLKEASKSNIRIKQYDADEIKKKYMMVYVGVLEKFLYFAIEEILNSGEYLQLQKSQDMKVLFGEYLDKTVEIYSEISEKEGEI